MKVYFDTSVSARPWTPSEKKLILETLNDYRSWMPSKWSETKSRQYADWSVSLESQELIDSYPGMKGLSVTFMSESPRKTMFSYENWASLPNAVKSIYTLKMYRQYLINHEAGHALGLGHPKRKFVNNTIAPVMIQQTLGLHGLLPNVWPTNEELLKLMHS